MNRKISKKIQELILEKYRKKDAKNKSSLIQSSSVGWERDPQMKGYPIIEIFNSDGSLSRKIIGENHVNVYATRFYGSRPLYLRGVAAGPHYNNDIPQLNIRENYRLYASSENLSGGESRFGVSGEVPAEKTTAWATFDSPYSGDDNKRGSINSSGTTEGVWIKPEGEESSYLNTIQRTTLVADWPMEKGNGVISELFLNYRDGSNRLCELLAFFDENKFKYRGVIPFLVPLGFKNDKATQKEKDENSLVLFGTENPFVLDSMQSSFFLVSYKNGLNSRNTSSRFQVVTGLEGYIGESFGVGTTGFDGSMGKPLIFNTSLSGSAVTVREIDLTMDTGDYDTFNTVSGAVGNTYTLDTSQAPIEGGDKVCEVRYTKDNIYLLMVRGGLNTTYKEFFILKYSKSTKGYISYERTGSHDLSRDKNYTTSTMIFNGENVERIISLRNETNENGTKSYSWPGYYEIRKAGNIFTLRFFAFGEIWSSDTERLYELRQISINSQMLFNVSRSISRNDALSINLMQQNVALAHYVLPEPVVKDTSQVMKITWVLDYYPNTLYGYFWDTLL